MAAVAEVTRIFNRDSIKIFGHNPDITVESDSQQFIAFTAALASCTRDYTFTATFLSSATVWIEFDGEYIRIHGPNCIFSHDDTKPVFQVPKNWKGAYQTNPYEEVPIGAYTPDVSLEQSLKQSLLRRVENEQWSEAYRNFFELLPCITLPETLDVASKIQAQPPYGLSVKSTIAMGLFWLGIQTQKEHSELA
ncbi:MAG TPA: hypothetical protein PLO43_01890, partial [Chlamydiales bacterium]|nr:hypothetical protein [Chlamydiales bacterium]